MDLAERIRALLDTQDSKGWIRLVDYLQHARLDPVIGLSAPASGFLDVVIELAADAPGARDEDEVLRRLEPLLPMGARGIAHTESSRRKAGLSRTTVQLDQGRTKKPQLVASALAAAGGTGGTPEVWGHLFSELERQGLNPREIGAKEGRRIEADVLSRDGQSVVPGKKLRFTFKGVQSTLRKLRTAPAQRGRPKKKPD